ncbi:reverse transcriptase domain-containing protein, partial [Tanacetum coccineum]
RVDGKFKPIYYASKTLNNAQEHYSTTKKELLAVVFAFDIFRPYLILSKTVVYTDHSALKDLFNKQDAKPYVYDGFCYYNGLISKLKTENLAADHLSRLENPHIEILTEREIVDGFLNEHLMILKAKVNDVKPWYADYVNYIAGRLSHPNGHPKEEKDVWLEARSSKFGHIATLDQLEDIIVLLSQEERTAYKTPNGCTPFRLAYGNACHLPVEIDHKAYWALKKCNMDLTAASKNHFMQLNEDKDFKVGDKVLLFNSHLKMYARKLKSKWYGPNVVKTVYLYGAIEITDKNGFSFKFNGQRLKKYYEGNIDKEDEEVIEFEADAT